MRRIDYLRQNLSVPQTGLNAPPGENPYVDEFGVLSYPECRRLMAKIPVNPPTAGHLFANTITHKDIVRYLGDTNGKRYRDFRDGNPNAIGRNKRRLLSRLLLEIESGHRVKRNGVLEFVPDPPPKKPDMMYRVELTQSGPKQALTVRIVRGEPLPVPKQMPRLFADFKLPGAK